MLNDGLAPDYRTQVLRIETSERLYWVKFGSVGAPE